MRGAPSAGCTPLRRGVMTSPCGPATSPSSRRPRPGRCRRRRASRDHFVSVKLLWLRRRGVGARGEPRHERQAPPRQHRLDEHRPRPRGARAPLPARRTRPGHPTSAIARRVRCSSTTGSGGCPGFGSRPTRLPRATRPRPRDQLRRCALARLRGSRDEGVALQRELRRPSLGANRQGAVPRSA
jgi:hypothetical protein